MTLETIERNADILLQKLINKKIDKTNIFLIVSTYIGGCIILEDLVDTDFGIYLKFIKKIDAIFKSGGS